MAKRQAGKKVSPRSGHVRLTVALTPGQMAWLVEEATRRAVESEVYRPDVSAVVREALDALRAKPPRR